MTALACTVDQPTGVITMPMVFGPSYSFDSHATALQEAGFPTEQVDYYQTQSFTVPFWASMVDNPTPIVAQIQLPLVYTQIDTAIDKINNAGCREVALVGFGLGADMALWYAQAHPEKQNLKIV